MIDFRQIKAARALLDWRLEDLSNASGVATRTLQNIESATHVPRPENLEKIRLAIENAGIEFLPQSGVRLKNDFIDVWEGVSGLERLLDDVYATVREKGGDILVSGVEEARFLEGRTSESILNHRVRMSALKNTNFKVLISAHDDNAVAEPYIEYRKVHGEFFASVPFYVYGEKLAIIIWGKKTKIILHYQPDLVMAYKQQFNLIWRTAQKI